MATIHTDENFIFAGGQQMKIDRLVSIIMLLLDKKRISAQELADLFEVSLRTIYRDIDTINMAGIPVCSTSGVGGGFEIMQKYKVDGKVFSTADLSAILMGLSNLSGLIQGEETVNALAKVKSFVPADRAKDIEFHANQILIDLSPWIGNRNIQQYLETIKTALRESRLLSFEYSDRHGNKTARTAEPYQLVLKSAHWYVQGYCLERKDFRLFKLTRMANLRLQAESFTPREHQKPQLEFTDVLATLQTTVKLRIHKSVKERALDFCEYEHFSPDGDEHWIVDFPFIENDFCYNILFSFGDKCECLEPSHVRAEMKRRIQDIAAIYGS
jgi:predicted DNA-binding transcriptional regulator YafY